MSNTERVRAWEPPTLPAATELGATVEVDGKTYKTVDTYASLDLGWVQLVFESPDGQVVYDPPLERPLPSWRVIIEDELPDVPPLPDPDPEPSEELLVRFTLHAPTEEQGERMSRLRAAHMRLAALVEAKTPASREQSLALTHLEEALFWALGAIVRREVQEEPESEIIVPTRVREGRGS